MLHILRMNESRNTYELAGAIAHVTMEYRATTGLSAVALKWSSASQVCKVSESVMYSTALYRVYILTPYATMGLPAVGLKGSSVSQVCKVSQSLDVFYNIISCVYSNTLHNRGLVCSSLNVVVSLVGVHGVR